MSLTKRHIDSLSQEEQEAILGVHNPERELVEINGLNEPTETMVVDENYQPRHTPGPWRAGKLHTAGIVQINDEKHRAIAQAWDWPEVEANARLIAAAPDLLEVLERSLQQSNCPGDNCNIDWHAQARVVIAKARGE